MTTAHYWWQNGTVYQIYPRSFQDSNGDGVGDLPGITQRLDYLAALGIDAVWISPMYPSPMADFGYDVSDYTDVHPLFGTLADMDGLIAAAHERNIKIILDLVPNHSSDQHPWFVESRSSRDNPKRDWYIWRDPAPDGGPPNNWIERFSGESAWEFDAATGQYYLHQFLKEQPDLNWRNPELRAAMLDVVRFWYERGVDGFRVDVSYRVMKDPAFPDNPPNPAYRLGMDPHSRLLERYNKDIPDVHQFNRWLREASDQYPDRVLIGEINLAIDRLVAHYGNHDEFHLPFNFHLIHTPWDAVAIRELVARYEAALPEGAWPNWVLGNHDQHRVAARIGAAQARVAMMLLLTLRGTPTLYYGDELGMPDGVIPPDKIKDPWEINVPGLGLGRDPERTPMQWDDSTHAGFCGPDVTPWLPLAPGHEQLNVSAESTDPTSMLSLTQTLLRLRRAHGALNRGAYRALTVSSDTVLAYARQDGAETLVVALNFSAESQQIPAPIAGARPLLTTYCDDNVNLSNSTLTLRPNEGVILR